MCSNRDVLTLRPPSLPIYTGPSSTLHQQSFRFIRQLHSSAHQLRALIHGHILGVQQLGDPHTSTNGGRVSLSSAPNVSRVSVPTDRCVRSCFSLDVYPKPHHPTGSPTACANAFPRRVCPVAFGRHYDMGTSVTALDKYTETHPHSPDEAACGNRQ
jgi:hypothetical protein